MPKALEILLFIYCMCSNQVNLESSITLRNLIDVTNLIGFSLI